jgi:hypothetical protein
VGDTTSLVPGYPIRTSSDPRSVDNSPRHIAASHVLHRPLMPRHPPCALTHLQTQENTRTKTKQQLLLDARNHYPITQTPHPTTKRGDNHPPTGCCLRTQQCAGGLNLLSCTRSPPTTGLRPLSRLPTPRRGGFFVVLLRKEVIQPHLPVRLPCYDFVPIADPTFDHSLPCGLGHGLRVLPTFMT